MQINNLVGQYYPLLDHGFVGLQGVMGGDTEIEQFARVSYQKGTRKVTDTRGLIRYLVSMDHGSPLEAVEFSFHIRCPIFVARQWFRHRIGSFCEQSARYSVMQDLFYVPEAEELLGQSAANKQGREGEPIPDSGEAQGLIEATSRAAFGDYQWLLDHGLTRELSRIVLPMNAYTEFYWKLNLRSLFNFLRLRCDSHAQREIRVYAEVIARMVEVACPLAFEAWMDYEYAAQSLSRMEMEVLREAYLTARPRNEETTEYYDSRKKELGMTQREIDAFHTKCSEPIPEIPLANWDLLYTPEPTS